MTLRRILLCPALVLMIVGGPLLGPVAAQSEPSNLCSGDPCVVTADASVDAGSMLDFGPRVLVLAEGVAVTLAVGDGSGTLEIHAAEIIFEPGAKISAGGIDQSSLHFEATEGSILLRSERSNRSEIDVGAGGTMAGSIKLLALADVTADGRLTAVASGEDAVGGSIQITAGGNVAISQEIRTEARDGASSSGGDVRIEAGGGISIAAGMILSGSGVGGSLLASALESIVLSASVTSDGLGPEGFAGQISLEAGGDLQLTSTGALEGSGGSGGADECGDGSETELRAGGSILLEGSIETAGGFDCRGGDVKLVAQVDVVQQGGSISTRTKGDSAAGDVLVSAGREARLRQIDASGTTGNARIVVDAVSLVEVSGGLDASAKGSYGFPGRIELSACRVDVLAPKGSLKSTGSFLVPGRGENKIRLSDPSSILSGRFDAAQSNRLEYRESAPGFTGNADPPFEFLRDEALPPCANTCGDGEIAVGEEACDDGNTLSCDGCRKDCSRVDAFCGDGIVECGEQCDDGNSENGDGCEVDCTPSGQEVDGVLIPGRGRRVGCQGQWRVNLPNPETSDDGRPRDFQSCTDGGVCDQDGRIDGSCSIESRFCMQVEDETLPECDPDDLVSRLILKNPVPTARVPNDRANANALLSALGSLGPEVYAKGDLVSPGAAVPGRLLCSSPADLRIPITGQSGRKKFKVRTVSENGRLMRHGEVRLQCLPNTSVCGNGDAEPGEQCDDGNALACDGCFACREEICGNGLIDCGEQCDEGSLNGEDGVRCDASCRVRVPALRISGGGAVATDCYSQWSMDLDEANVALDPRGRPANLQNCRDNDPGCDLDPSVGTCRVRVYACFGGNEESSPSCPRTSIQRHELIKPSSQSRHPMELQARIALEEALNEVSFPTAGDEEACTSGSLLWIPVGKKLTIKNRAFASTGKRDKDRLSIFCQP